MRITRAFFVTVGELLRAGPWNLAGRAIRALQLVSGIGVRLRETPNGTFVNFDGSKAIFINPFKVTLSGTNVKVRWGQINGVNGKIGKKELKPVYEDEPEPELELRQFNLNDDGRGWVAAEVTCSEKDWSVKSWEIVQVADLDTPDGKVGKNGPTQGSAGGVPNLPGRKCRQPLAMLIKQRSGQVVVRQITFFHLTHRRRANTQNPKADVGTHFFFPRG